MDADRPCLFPPPPFKFGNFSPKHERSKLVCEGGAGGV